MTNSSVKKARGNATSVDFRPRTMSQNFKPNSSFMISSTRLSFCVLKCNKTNLYFNFQKISSALGLRPYMRYFSTEKLKEETEISIREKIRLGRPSVTKWKRPPFAKNLFMGKLDTELLAFPEILDREHLEEVEKIVLSLNALYKDKVNSLKIDEDGNIPEDVLQEFKEMGLFGRLAPQKYGGLEMTYTAYTRLNEAIGLDWSIGAILGIHELMGIEALLCIGTEAQKQKYIPDLVSGKKIATLCNYETKSGCDPTSVGTIATNVQGTTDYILNGMKTWVTNAISADLYIVMAKMPASLVSESPQTVLFLVDKTMNGVKSSVTSDNNCLRGTGVGVVHFNEVIVPKENMLGQPGLGHAALNKLHETCRFGMSSLSLGVLKTFCDHITEYVINAERNDKTLADFLLVRKRLAKVTQRIYAMESITYFTAAIYDSSDNPDCAIESAILKVYNSESTLFCLQELMKVVGAMSLSKSQQLERFYRNAQGLAIFESPNDIVRLFIGLSGCKFVGEHRASEIEKYRNPFFFPLHRIKLFLRYRRIAKDKFKYNQDIAGHLHPSLVPQGNRLEECVQMLDGAVDFTLQAHGKNVLEIQLDPIRLANMVIEIYVMTAILSRMSRSYCIGLRNNDHELKIAYAYCNGAYDRIQKSYEEILDGLNVNNDGLQLMVGEQVIDCKGYFPEHPLKHNL